MLSVYHYVLNIVSNYIATVHPFSFNRGCPSILMLLQIYFLNDAHANVSTVYSFLISGSCLIIVVQSTGGLVASDIFSK